MKDEGPSAIDFLKWALFVLAGIWFVWLITGGPARYETRNGFMLKPPSPLSTGETYGQLPQVDIKIPDLLNTPTLGNRAALGAKTTIGSTDPNKEYLEIVGLSDSPVDITGWKITGKNGSAIVPKGVRLFKKGAINKEEDIYLAKGDRAIIISGSSPVGYSFLINKCSGYLSQFQIFYPKISSDSCPSLIEADTPSEKPLDSACLNYINKMPVCETPVYALPGTLSSVCHEFILNHSSYNACVTDSKDKSGFYKNEWRIYLSKEKALWGKSDSIKFYGENNKPIGTYSY